MILLFLIVILALPLAVLGLTRLGMFKGLACKLGWHSPSRLWLDAHHHESDPLKTLTFAKCPWCGYTGQIDSQGNLF